MINEKLRQTFNLIEVAAFPEWQKSNKEQRKLIVKKIAKIEVMAIIKDAKRSAKKQLIKRN